MLEPNQTTHGNSENTSDHLLRDQNTARKPTLYERHLHPGPYLQATTDLSAAQPAHTSALCGN